MTVCKPCHLIEHDVADTAIGSLDVKEAKTIVCQGMLNILNVSQMLHEFICADAEIYLPMQ